MACSINTDFFHRKVGESVDRRSDDMSGRKITVTSETESGRNTRFNVPSQGEVTRQTLVQQIRAGEHDDYHVRIINGLATPVSNPNGNGDDNLG